MSVAWTTVLIIVLLLPGVFFLMGFAARERHAREIVRSNAVSDVGVAVLVAILLHLASWYLLWFIFGFDLAQYFKPLAHFDTTPSWLIWDYIVQRLSPVTWYVIITAVLAWALGFVLAGRVVSGQLRFMATHKWVYEVVKFSGKRRGVVTAYVMTKTVENNRALMYKGLLQEFYLNADGRFAYIVIKNCTKYYMKFDDDAPKTGAQLSLFKSEDDGGPGRVWNYLMIDGGNIANILFDPSPAILQTDRGTKALEEAIRDLQEKIDLVGKEFEQ